ncbi:MAG: DUF4080 domain-containing protein, partial [Bacillota bacterium]
NAKFIHTNNAVRLLKANSSYASEFIEFTIKDDLDAIARTLIERNPLFIGISTYIWNVETVKSLVRTLKSNSDIPIILGGPEVSYDAKTFLESLPIDLVVKGEGEHIIDDVTAHYQDGASLEGVNNIAYRTSKGTVVDKPIVEIKDLSTLRSPHRFEQDIPDLENRIQYVESSRGCPFNCSYCLSSLEKKVRFFPLEQVLTDLEHLLENGAKTIKFLDRTFNANKDAQAIIDFLIEHRTAGSVFQFEITGEIMDEALIDHIHAHAPKHLFRFEIGIQSTHDQTNKLVRRFQDNAKLFHLIRKIREADIIDMHLDLIAGLPEESLDRFKKTFNDVFALGSRELQLGFLKFLRGTKIREEKDRFGYVFQSEAPYTILRSDVLSEEDLKTIGDVETALNLFHNKRYFNDALFPVLKKGFTDYFSMFKTIHDAYIDAGHPLKGYQIDTVYRFMHAFLKDHGIPQKDLDILKKTYLKRSKVKPKCFFETLSDKTVKNRIFTELAQRESIPIADFYKHSVVVPMEEGYTVALYKDHASYLYTLDI